MSERSSPISEYKILKTLGARGLAGFSSEDWHDAGLYKTSGNTRVLYFGKQYVCDK